jgi:hypothetical protein
MIEPYHLCALSDTVARFIHRRTDLSEGVFAPPSADRPVVCRFYLVTDFHLLNMVHAVQISSIRRGRMPTVRDVMVGSSSYTMPVSAYTNVLSLSSLHLYLSICSSNAVYYDVPVSPAVLHTSSHVIPLPLSPHPHLRPSHTLWSARARSEQPAASNARAGRLRLADPHVQLARRAVLLSRRDAGERVGQAAGPVRRGCARAPRVRKAHRRRRRRGWWCECAPRARTREPSPREARGLAPAVELEGGPSPRPVLHVRRANA